MSLTTVTGRVRGTVRLKASEDAGRARAPDLVGERSRLPAHDRRRGRLRAGGGDGAVYRVDPFEALVALPVREIAVRAGVRHEAAWIAVADEITVEGELAAARGRTPAALRARRIGMASGAARACTGCRRARSSAPRASASRRRR